jgi:uncharacterized protein
MSIINAHVHLIDVQSAMAGSSAAVLEYLKKIPGLGDVSRVLTVLSEDELLRQMDEAGIERSVLFALYGPILTASNEFVRDACLRHPDRFWGYASVDPHDERAPEILENAIVNYGLKGLKLHPPLQGVYPNDPKLWPLYEKAQALRIPVVFHVGGTPFGALVRLDQAQPILLDEVAIAFPELRIVLTHLGTLWHNESFMLVEKHPHVYIDMAAYPYEIRDLVNAHIVERAGSHKWLFGTDFPMPYEGRMHRMADFVETVRDLPLADGIKNGMFSGNLNRLLTRT